MEITVGRLRKKTFTDTEQLFWMHKDDKDIHWDVRNDGDTPAKLERLLNKLHPNCKVKYNTYNPIKFKQKQEEAEAERELEKKLRREFDWDNSIAYKKVCKNSLTTNTYTYHIDKKNKILCTKWGVAVSYYELTDKELKEQLDTYNNLPGGEQ